MRKTQTALLLALALALAAAPSALADSGPSPIISFENSYQACYSLDASDIGGGFGFALGFGLTDKLQAQVSMLQGDTVIDSYRLLGLSYDISPKVGATVMAGKGMAAATGPVAGLGFYAVLLSRDVPGGPQTSLKLRVNYLAPVASLANGVVGFGLSAGIGI